MDSIKDADVVGKVGNRTPAEHPFLGGSMDTGAGCLRCGLSAFASCHAMTSRTVEDMASQAQAAAEQARQEKMRAEMERQMWEAAGEPARIQGGMPDIDHAEIKAARKSVLLRLSQVACGVESMTADELQAAYIMLNAGF